MTGVAFSWPPDIHVRGICSCALLFFSRRKVIACTRARVNEFPVAAIDFYKRFLIILGGLCQN